MHMDNTTSTNENQDTIVTGNNKILTDANYRLVLKIMKNIANNAGLLEEEYSCSEKQNLLG